jgi:hypothetical protein
MDFLHPFHYKKKGFSLCLSVPEPETSGITIHISTPPERVRLERDRNQFLVGRRLVTPNQTILFLVGRRLVTPNQTILFLVGKRQWWASLHDVITALQIGRYQFCLKR